MLAILLADAGGPFFPKFKAASGFFALAELLPHHAHLPEIYFILLAMLLGRPMSEIPAQPILQLSNLHEVFQFAVKVAPSSSSFLHLFRLSSFPFPVFVFLTHLAKLV